MKYGIVVCLLGVVACVQVAAPPAPEPLTVGTVKTARDVASLAVRELTESGFDILVSDAVAGIVTAKRTRRATENAEYIACKNNIGGLGVTPMATNTLTSTVTVTVTTRDSAGATVARIASRAEGAFEVGGTGTSASIQCSSKGDVERRIATAIASPPP